MFLTEVEIEDDKHYKQSEDEATKQSNMMYNEEMQAQFDEVLDSLLTLANKDNSEINDNHQSEEGQLNSEDGGLLSEHEVGTDIHSDSDMQNYHKLDGKEISTVILLEKQDCNSEINTCQNEKYEENIFITESIPLDNNKSCKSNDEKNESSIIIGKKENKENTEMQEYNHCRNKEDNVEETSTIIIETNSVPVNESNRELAVEQNPDVSIEENEDCKGTDNSNNMETNQMPAYDQAVNDNNIDFEVKDNQIEEEVGYKSEDDEYNTETRQEEISHMTVTGLDKNKSNEFTEVGNVSDISIGEEDKDEKKEYIKDTTDTKENNKKSDVVVEVSVLNVMQDENQDQSGNKGNDNIKEDRNDDDDSEMDDNFDDSYQSSSPDRLTIIFEEKEVDQECEIQNNNSEKDANEEETTSYMISEENDKTQLGEETNSINQYEKEISEEIKDKPSEVIFIKKIDNHEEQTAESSMELNDNDNEEKTSELIPIIIIQGKEITVGDVKSQFVKETFSPENTSVFMTEGKIVVNDSDDFDPDSLEENDFEKSSLLLDRNKEDEALIDNVFQEENTMPTDKLNIRSNDTMMDTNIDNDEKESLNKRDDRTNIVDAIDKETLLAVPHNSFCINRDPDPIGYEYSYTENSFDYEPYVPLQKVNLTAEEDFIPDDTRSKPYSEDQESEERSLSFVYIPVVDNDIEEDIRKQMLDRKHDDELESAMHAKRFETRKLSSDILEAVESFLDTKIDLEKALERDSDMTQEEGSFVDSNGVKLRRKPRTSSNMSLTKEDMQKVKNRLSGAGNEEAVARFVQELIEEEMKKASRSTDSTDEKQHSPELDEDEQMIAEVVQALIREEMELEKENELIELCCSEKVDIQLYEEFKNVILFALLLFVFLLIVN